MTNFRYEMVISGGRIMDIFHTILIKSIVALIWFIIFMIIIFIMNLKLKKLKKEFEDELIEITKKQNDEMDIVYTMLFKDEEAEDD